MCWNILKSSNIVLLVRKTVDKSTNLLLPVNVKQTSSIIPSHPDIRQKNYFYQILFDKNTKKVQNKIFGTF